MLPEQIGDVFDRAAGHPQHRAIAAEGRRGQEDVGAPRDRRRPKDSGQPRRRRREGGSDEHDEREHIESIHPPRQVAVVAGEPHRVVEEQAIAAPDERAADVLIEGPSLA